MNNKQEAFLDALKENYARFAQYYNSNIANAEAIQVGMHVIDYADSKNLSKDSVALAYGMLAILKANVNVADNINAPMVLENYEAEAKVVLGQIAHNKLSANIDLDELILSAKKYTHVIELLDYMVQDVKELDVFEPIEDEKDEKEDAKAKAEEPAKVEEPAEAEESEDAEATEESEESEDAEAAEESEEAETSEEAKPAKTAKKPAAKKPAAKKSSK